MASVSVLSVQVAMDWPPRGMTFISTASTPPSFLNSCLKVYQPLSVISSGYERIDTGPRSPGALLLAFT